MAFLVENVDWSSASQRLTELREKVFVLEWQMPRDSEFDEHDHRASHIIISTPDKQPIATARLTEHGEIGRMAIRIGYRNLPVYRLLFSALIAQARVMNVASVRLCCDLTSVDHHTKLGFTPTGQVFMEAGIARQVMTCPISRCKLPDVTQLH
ncbi:GNAT family N-acetyltransferase [Salinimonas sediminis]|uniref:GNAT family N-acetyltransferase n=1 Tax=Salinimonas sediminis TaxID=2303538 RepID=A0A346NMU6_9ALTE|nr:GNAT family N-acetyltransferase [Salinimonas sediminis]AXR06853.1 GNAT family N-acetyltransferase [Salinimonas sediminis]